MEEAGLGGSRYALPSWVPDWTSKGPPNDPSLIYFVDDIPVSRDNENHKVVRSQAVKPGMDNTLDVSCSGLVLSQRFWTRPQLVLTTIEHSRIPCWLQSD
jgi:hypothetical protein